MNYQNTQQHGICISKEIHISNVFLMVYAKKVKETRLQRLHYSSYMEYNHHSGKRKTKWIETDKQLPEVEGGDRGRL